MPNKTWQHKNFFPETTQNKSILRYWDLPVFHQDFNDNTGSEHFWFSQEASLHLCSCDCFAGSSLSAADDLQRSLREAADVSQADGTVAPPPTSPQESLQHRPVLPLPVHQEEDPSVTERGAVKPWFLHTELLNHTGLSWRLFKDSSRIFDQTKDLSGGPHAPQSLRCFIRQLAAVCSPMRPLQFCVCTKQIPVCLLQTVSAPCQMLSAWEHAGKKTIKQYLYSCTRDTEGTFISAHVSIPECKLQRFKYS